MLPVDLCCSFVKINITTGKIIWQTKMLPDNGGQRGLYVGLVIWGSSPSIITSLVEISGMELPHWWRGHTLQLSCVLMLALISIAVFWDSKTDSPTRKEIKLKTSFFFFLHNKENYKIKTMLWKLICTHKVRLYLMTIFLSHFTLEWFEIK